jgi:hypothetical protein
MATKHADGFGVQRSRSMTAHTHSHSSVKQGSPIQAASALVGAVFLLVGVLGFIPGITAHYDGLRAAGHESNAELLGVFQVSVLHNIVHLLFGAAGIALARTASGARAFLVGAGASYLVLWLYGLVIDKTSQANFVPLNHADDWLHLVLGVAMVGLGVVLGRRRPGVTAH